MATQILEKAQFIEMNKNESLKNVNFLFQGLKNGILCWIIQTRFQL